MRAHVAHMAADLQAVHARQPDVEDDQVGRRVEHRLQRDAAVARRAAPRSPRAASARASGSAMSWSSSTSSTRVTITDRMPGARGLDQSFAVPVPNALPARIRHCRHAHLPRLPPSAASSSPAPSRSSASPASPSSTCSTRSASSRRRPYMGWMYVGLMLSCLAVAAALVRANSREAWLAAIALPASAIVGFVLTRTVGLPQAERGHRQLERAARPRRAVRRGRRDRGRRLRARRSAPVPPDRRAQPDGCRRHCVTRSRFLRDH